MHRAKLEQGGDNVTPLDQELDQLINGFLDGILSESEVDVLASRLKVDRVARDRYRELVGLHSSLQWDYAALAMEAEEPGIPGQPARILWAWVGGIGVAAMLLVLALWSGSQPGLLSIEDVYGPVTWSDGSTETIIRGGEKLPGGTFSVEAEDAYTVIAFRDGTKVRINGGAEIECSETRQKLLHLRQGTMSAEVEPQPDGLPMIVKTNSAEVEVLGTAFSLDAEGYQTSLVVDSGQVHLRRLSDGQGVTVSQNERVRATLDPAEALVAVPRNIPPKNWRLSYQEPPLPRWKGKWSGPQLAGLPYFQAVACVAKRNPDGTKVIRYGITARGDGRHLVTLTADSVFEMRYRTRSDSNPQIMMTTNKPGGAFAGNFQYRIPDELLAEPSSEWHRLRVPLAEFEALTGERYPEIVEGSQVSLVFVTTLQNAGLEVAGLAILEGRH